MTLLHSRYWELAKTAELHDPLHDPLRLPPQLPRCVAALGSSLTIYLWRSKLLEAYSPAIVKNLPALTQECGFHAAVETRLCLSNESAPRPLQDSTRATKNARQPTTSLRKKACLPHTKQAREASTMHIQGGSFACARGNLNVRSRNVFSANNLNLSVGRLETSEQSLHHIREPRLK
jgi:hypothetical protein